MIPRNVRLSEAPSHGKPALLYDLRCAGSQAYIHLAGEMLRRDQRPKRPTCRRNSAGESRGKAHERRQKRGLGRGLSALLGEGRHRPRVVAPRQPICPSTSSSRARCSRAAISIAEELESLAESIRANGILQPLLVRRHPSQPDLHEIVAGERRWRAAQLAGLTRCRCCCASSPIAKPWRSRWSRTSSATICRRWKRPRAIAA